MLYADGKAIVTKLRIVIASQADGTPVMYSRIKTCHVDGDYSAMKKSARE